MKLKRSDVYILHNGENHKKEIIKVAGYMFYKNGHWFTVRRNDPAICKSSCKGKWIISDFVTGLIMSSTDNTLDDVPMSLADSLIDKLIEFYKDNSVNMYRRESSREEFQKYAQMMNEAMYKDGQDKLIDYLQDSAYELFN